MGKTLFVGPWAGEFGWELCQWQAYARKVAVDGGFDRVVVCTYPGHQGMYADFATDFLPLPQWFLTRGFEPDVIAADGCWTDCQDALAKDVVAGLPIHTRISPSRTDLSVDEQKWADWTRASVVDRDLVVLVKRRRTFDADRNWSEGNWLELDRRLRAEGFRIAYTEDDWDRSLDLLSSCAMAVGGSTGGLHLASLCKCPHLVWGDHGMYDLADRYNRLWNPHQTPCRVLLSGWHPTVEHVVTEIKGAMIEISRA